MRVRAVIAAVVLITAIEASADESSKGSRHVAWPAQECLSCHAADDADRIGERLNRPCAQLCQTCHSSLQRHHPIGVTVAGRVDPPLLLTADGRNTCSTCHDPGLPRVANVQWVSKSFFERTIGRGREHRTALLAMRNDRGELCRQCH